MGEVIFRNNRAFVMDERWITIGGEDNDGSGHHVLIKENGTITAGFGKGRNVKNAFGGSQKSSDNKHETKAREAVDYWLKTHYKEENDKNIKASVESVRSQMEHRLKSAEKNLRDAKKLGKPEIEKKFQEKYDEAKGELDALDKYYDGYRMKGDTSKNSNENNPRISKLKKPEALIRQDKIKNAYTEKAKAFSKREDELIKEGDEAYKEYLKKKTKKNKAIYENKQSEIDGKMNALMKEWKEERRKYTDAYFKNQKTFGKAHGTVREVYGENDNGYEKLKSILEAYRKQKRGAK